MRSTHSINQIQPNLNEKFLLLKTKPLSLFLRWFCDHGTKKHRYIQHSKHFRFHEMIWDRPASPNNHISRYQLTDALQLICFRICDCLVDVWWILMTLTSIQDFTELRHSMWRSFVLRWASSGYIKRQPNNSWT